MLFRANAGAARGLTGRRLANDRLRNTATSGTQAAGLQSTVSTRPSDSVLVSVSFELSLPTTPGYVIQ